MDGAGEELFAGAALAGEEHGALGDGHPLQEADGGGSHVSNHVVTADTLLFDAAGALTGFADRAASQTYSSRSSGGACYNRTITAADGLLTSITDGHGCGEH